MFPVKRIVVFGVLWGQWTVAVVEASNRHDGFDPEKRHPGMGNPSCSSNEDSFYDSFHSTGEFPPACREEDGGYLWDDEDDSADEEPTGLANGTPSCGDEFEGEHTEEEDDEYENIDRSPPFSNGCTIPQSPPENHSPALFGVCPIENCPSFRFNLYIGTDPNYQSLGFLIRPGLTEYLNMAQSDYQYYEKWYTPGEEQSQETRTSVLGGALDFLSSLFSENPNSIAKLYLVLSDPEVIQREPTWWWWKYRLQYNCYYSDTDLPVIDKDFLAQLRKDTINTIARGIGLGEIAQGFWEQFLDHRGYDLPFDVLIRLVPPESGAPVPVPPSLPDADVLPFESLPPDTFGSPTQMPLNETAKGNAVPLEAFDITEWDIRRYMGLGILMCTIVGTVILTQVATFRRRKRDKKHLWGNLATEEGVNELLRTGWKIQGGKMEIFDKKGVGYLEDDSIFMGGFEQTEVLGGEITITQSNSETTPETAVVRTSDQD